MNRSALASRSSVESPGRTMSRMRASVPATMRPARAITSISRGDLRVIMSAAKGLAHAVGDLVDRADGGDAADAVARLVPGQERGGLLAIGAETGRHRRRVVVGPLLHGAAPLQPGQDLVVG